jgi:hypothetical protein
MAERHNVLLFFNVSRLAPAPVPAFAVVSATRAGGPDRPAPVAPRPFPLYNPPHLVHVNHFSPRIRPRPGAAIRLFLEWI